MWLSVFVELYPLAAMVVNFFAGSRYLRRCIPHNTVIRNYPCPRYTYDANIPICIHLPWKRKWCSKTVIRWKRWYNRRIAWCYDLHIMDYGQWIAICSYESPKGKWMYVITYLPQPVDHTKCRTVGDRITRIDTICNSIWFAYHLYLLLLGIVGTEQASHK